MAKKVWDISDTIIEEESKKGADPSFTKNEKSSFDIREEKNPAISASLSIFFWGSGQIYNKYIRQGLLLLSGMGILAAASYFILAKWDAIFNYLKGTGFTSINIIMMFFFLYAAAALVWYGNVLHAYYQADRKRVRPFNGIENLFISGITSIFIPGWGQFMNGQPKKGAIYLFAFFSGIFGLLFVVSAAALWPTIDLEYEKPILETIILASISIVFLSALLWLINIFDAIIVASDPIKKEPIGKRMKYAINRVKNRRNQIEIMKRLKVAFFLVLLLILSIAISYSLFPKEYYHNRLTTLSRDLDKKGMNILPALISNTADTIFYNGQRSDGKESNI